MSRTDTTGADTIRDTPLPLYDPDMLPDPEMPLGIDFGRLNAFHGGGNPGGVAYAVAAMHAALPLLGEGLHDRRGIRVVTSFPGPGARDAFEGALRAVSGDRYVVDPALAQPERGAVLARYVFRLEEGDRAVTVRLRDEGYVVPEFLEVGAIRDRTPEQDARLGVLKLEMTERIVSRLPGEVYEVV